MPGSCRDALGLPEARVARKILSFMEGKMKPYADVISDSCLKNCERMCVVPVKLTQSVSTASLEN